MPQSDCLTCTHWVTHPDSDGHGSCRISDFKDGASVLYAPHTSANPLTGKRWDCSDWVAGEGSVALLPNSHTAT